MSADKDLFIGIDANAIIHRAFHAYPPSLSTSSGTPVNAVYGFTVMLLQLLKQFDPKYIVCAFDTKAPTFRHTKYTDYKAHRKPTDESLIAQFPLVEEILKAFNIPIIKKEGYEADDILGTFSQWVKDGKWSSYNLDLYLITGDRDLLQLIGGSVYTCLPAGGFNNLVVYDKAKTLEKYGYAPEQVTDFKAIVGDASDNIPGIKGIGEKSALTLLRDYTTLDNIYKNIEKLSSKHQKLFTEGAEQAGFSKDLATIKTDVDLDVRLEQCLFRDFDENELLYTFKKFEFRSLVSKIPKSVNGGGNGAQLGMFGGSGGDDKGIGASASIRMSQDINEFLGIKNPSLRICGYISPDESEDGGEFVFGLIVDNSGEQMGYVSGDVGGFVVALTRETWFYNLEDFVSRIIRQNGDTQINTEGIRDLRLLSHLLSSGKKSYDLSSLIFDFASRNAPEFHTTFGISSILPMLSEVIEGIQKKVGEIEIGDYTAGWLKKIFKKEATPLIYYDLLEKVENPVSIILAKMENRGIAVDYDYLVKLEETLGKKISEIEKNIYTEVGHEFNINSPKQLSDVLYTELQLPQPGTGKSARSTREDVLERLKEMHPAIPLIMEYRELAKLHGTYAKPFVAMVSEMHNRGEECVIHTDFKQIGASSGRFSSLNPNMQNIPQKGEGEKMRNAFVARKGFKLVSADYSQIEFRVMADISEDSALLLDFNAGKDIHKATAARIFNKPLEEVTKEDRYLAKTMNFSILFGQTSYGLSRLLGIDSKLAAQYIDEYFKNYKGVKEYIEKAKRTALEKGYVQTMFGRTRYITGLSSRNFNVRGAAVREAINMPIQGGEADIMKLAMIDIDRMIKERYDEKAFILLQIHDELVFEVEEKLVGNFEKDIAKVMKEVVKMKVPLDVNTASGGNLSELK